MDVGIGAGAGHARALLQLHRAMTPPRSGCGAGEAVRTAHDGGSHRPAAGSGDRLLVVELSPPRGTGAGCCGASTSQRAGEAGHGTGGIGDSPCPCAAHSGTATGGRPAACAREQAAEAALLALRGIDGALVIVDNDSGDGSYEAMTAAVRARGWDNYAAPVV